MPTDKICALALALALMAGCGMMDDLTPSGADKREGALDLAPGSASPDYSMPDIWGAEHTLAADLAGRRGAVLYFAMWCPICDSHMQSILRGVVPHHPDVAFVVVDYVSGSVSGARNMAQASGYANGPFTILVDQRQSVLKAYGATMGTTVVVDGAGIIHMIEDYKSEAQLLAALAGL